MNNLNAVNSKLRLDCLKIISINVNSLIQNQRRATLLKLTREQKPDIVLINETKLNEKHKIEFKNYSMIRRDRPNNNQGGGVAILIKKPIKFKIVGSEFSSNTIALETLGINISLEDSKNLIVVSTYAPHGKSEEFATEFDNLFSSLKLDNLKTIILFLEI